MPVISGLLESRSKKRVSITPVITMQDIKNVFFGLDNMIKYQYKMKYLNIEINQNTFFNMLYKDEEDIKYRSQLMEHITNNSCTDYTPYKAEFDNFRINILENILKVYQKFNPILFYTSIVAFVIFVLINIINKNKKIEELIILLGLVAVYLSRITTVTFTYKTMYTEAMNYMYLSNIYSIQMIFGALAIYFVIKEVKNIVKNYINNKKMCKKDEG